MAAKPHWKKHAGECRGGETPKSVFQGTVAADRAVIVTNEFGLDRGKIQLNLTSSCSD